MSDGKCGWELKNATLDGELSVVFGGQQCCPVACGDRWCGGVSTVAPRSRSRPPGGSSDVHAVPFRPLWMGLFYFYFLVFHSARTASLLLGFLAVRGGCRGGLVPVLPLYYVQTPGLKCCNRPL